MDACLMEVVKEARRHQGSARPSASLFFASSVPSKAKGGLF
jgi:hypothetical protein